MSQSLADKLLPKRLKDDLERVLLHHNSQRANIESGVVSAATRLARRQVVLLAFAQLWEMGYRLNSARSLGERHIRCLVERWDAEDLVAGTLHTRLSYLSTFCGWIGKAGSARCLVEYCGKERIARHQATEVNKSWEAKGIDPNQVIAKAMDIDKRLALYLKLQFELGLRVKESIEFRPVLSLMEDGRTLEIFEGTKGGRRRTVTIETDGQREALEWAIRMTKGSRSGRIRWPELSFKQAYARFYMLLRRRLGVSRRALGLTAHGLRHGFAQKKYRRLTGLPTPVEGGAIGRIDHQTHHYANLQVSKALGHWRDDVVASYYGTYGHALRNATVIVRPPVVNLAPSSAARMV